ncbi:MAG TPA: alpha/beta hydrolase [Verrucomicrobiae bacterium]
MERDVSYGGSTQDSNVLWNVNSLADNLSSVEPDPYNANVLEVSYKVQAHYAGGNSAWSEAVPLQQADVSASIVPGPNGTTILVVSGVPANATAVRLVYYDWIESELEHDFSYNTNIDIPLSDFVNGEYVLPPSLQDLGEDAYGFEITPDFVQSVSANGDTTASDRIGNNADGTPFYDGRVQLKQNLIYLLRAASQNYPVGFTEYSTNEFYAGDYSGGYFQYTFSNPANYAWASPYHSNGSFDGNGSYYFSFDPDEPFDDNDRYLNFVFDADNLTAYGNLNTGAATSDGYALWDPEYQFTTVTTNAWLPPSDTRWLYSEWEIDQGDLITQSGQTISMASGVKNLFGLPYLSAALAYNTSSGVETGMVSAGGNFTLPSSATVGAVVYPETAQPAFQTVEYDFWNPASDPGGTPVPGVSLVPGEGGFSPTNESQLLITPVGTPLNIVGYAKLAVTNGYPGVYGYLGQYFTNAFAIDDSGNITTNSAGVISPYGNFLPLQAGPAALVTMPDPDTGQQGTCTVYCVSLNVDANHDGNMDLTFGGTDATSQANPMEFWIDDGSDVPGAGGNPDYDAPVPPASPNCVLAPFGQNQIKCPRDLENFARLWICGVPSIDSTGGYQVTLSWQNYSGNPAIILVPSYEADGGIGYLTNSTIAQNTIGYSSYGEVSPGTDLVIPDLFFDEAGTKHFLFEGSGIGEGELTMTITQNGNTIAQTGVWLDLHDIKDFYEVADATNVTSGLPPSSMISQYRIDHTTATQPNETKQVIVFVHGINNTYFDAKDSTETLFKRLYWSGYYGKVAEFKWPCAFLPFDNTLNPFNYDLGEFYAWKSAAALKDYLSYLTNRLAGYQIDILAHSQGNIVASEAIKQGAPFDNYILSQAAVSAQCYDTSVPTLSSLVAADAAVPTPLYPANGGYDGYFSGLTGNLINFYNTNDYALASGIWSGLQANWVADQKSQKPESYTYRFGQVYEYDTTNLTSTARYGFSSYTVTDPYEIMSQVARSRSSAAGAQPDIGGVMETSAQVDLLSSFGFGSTRGDHSAEFTRPIQQTFGYYQTILNKIQPAQ